MAESFAMYLKANGADIKGYSSVVSNDREGSCECYLFEDSVLTARERGSGMATGRREYKPITVRKRVDEATPLIAKALCDNEVIEAEFKFFRPNPTGDGTTEQYFTIRISGGRVASINRVSPDCISPASSKDPFYEDVSFVFKTCEWEYCDGGITHHDDWSQAK